MNYDDRHCSGVLGWSSRLFRCGQARVPRMVVDLADRLGGRAGMFQQRPEKLQRSAAVVRGPV